MSELSQVPSREEAVPGEGLSHIETSRVGRPVRAVSHGDTVLETENLDVWFGAHRVLAEISLGFPERSVTALIGPSGCGKSTFIRCLNRMHELVPDARVRGSVKLRDREIYAADADPVAIRRTIGMVFQRPNPFPTKSIAENVLSGPKFNRVRLSRSRREEVVEQALSGAGLWSEVKDRLHAPAGGLSGGQQQRLCIARSLAVEPDVLLMDEPCSALDPKSTAVIEDLIIELRTEVAIVIVTHNLQQAYRVGDDVAFMYLGDLVEYGAAEQVFGAPRAERTREYVRGAFG